MSSVGVNDENLGVCPGRKHSSSSNDIFALEQPTGRPSILRQTENLPNKTVVKGVKVCFQTPIRDPATKRILSPSKSDKMTSLDECVTAMGSLNLDQTITLPQDCTEPYNELKSEVSSYHGDDMPVQRNGGYQFDFGNFDAIDPFQGSNMVALSPARPAAEVSPTGEKESQHSKPENMLEDPTKTETALDETLPFIPSMENSLADTSTNICSTDSSVVTMTLVVPPVEEDLSTATPDEKTPSAPLSISQDKTAGTSFDEDAPLAPKGSYNFDFDNLDSVNPFQTGGSKIQNSPVLGKKPLSVDLPVKEMEPADIVAVPEVSAQPGVTPIAALAISKDATKITEAESIPQPIGTSAKEGAVKLEFNFADGGKVKRKPPPKLKSTVRKPAPEKDSEPPKESSVKPVANDVYSKMDNSPKCKNSSPPGKEPSLVEEVAVTELMATPVENEAVFSMCAGECVPETQPNHAVNKMSQDEEPKDASDRNKGFQPETVQPQLSTPGPFELGHHEQKSQIDTSEPNNEFVPGAMFMSNDFDGQFDYLEQFGSSTFQESALRKQSLYLKFDPLLRESPKKSGGPAAHNNLPQLAAFAPRLGAPQTAVSGAKKDLFDDAAAPTMNPVIQNPPMCLLPPTPEPANTEDAIIEVLKYSQKDMDEVIAKVQAEETDQEKERAMAQKKLSEVLQEKEQALVDLDSTERSMSELYRRLEKHMEVNKGYKKNEETLKACAREYMAKLKKEEQRYQTLKAHAEEKISHANEEIAAMRSKLNAEISALQVQLRREQMKVQSLEKNLEQKAKEAEELTNLCDELITKVHKG
ncbi:transforming acidic coiled-coil-containing protein 3 [Diretmus argenteus]